MRPLEVGCGHLHQGLEDVFGEGPPLRLVSLHPERGLHQLLQDLVRLLKAGLEVLDAQAITGLSLLLGSGYGGDGRGGLLGGASFLSLGGAMFLQLLLHILQCGSSGNDLQIDKIEENISITCRDVM